MATSTLVSIIYDSGYGHTAKQAMSVALGVPKVTGAEVRLIAIADKLSAMDRLTLEREKERKRREEELRRANEDHDDDFE